MPWEENAPLAALDAAVFAYKEISGLDAAIAWHERELARLKASRSIVARRLADAEPKAASAPAIDIEWTDKTVTALTDAVNYYARHDIYKGRKGDKPAVLADGGVIARQTIQEVYGDSNGGAE